MDITFSVKYGVCDYCLNRTDCIEIEVPDPHYSPEICASCIDRISEMLKVAKENRHGA